MNDFDFIFGSWTVANRQLRTVFTGSDEWKTFPSTATCRPIFDGGANIEEISFPTLSRHGFSLRLFDVERKEWSISWADSRTGLLYPPVRGTFTNGRGEFYGDDTHDGTPIRARFIWSDITPTSARWEQACSVDDGQTWETNWIMEFTRT